MSDFGEVCLFKIGWGEGLSSSLKTLQKLLAEARSRSGLNDLVLIAGGTDKKLEFTDWAKTVKKTVKPENLFLLESSATTKMIDALNRLGYFGKTPPQLYLDFNILLTSAVKRAKILKGKKTLLFSPGAASFEKFKNEFDRGEKFNRFFNKTRRKHDPA